MPRSLARLRVIRRKSRGVLHPAHLVRTRPTPVAQQSSRSRTSTAGNSRMRETAMLSRVARAEYKGAECRRRRACAGSQQVSSSRQTTEM